MSKRDALELAVREAIVKASGANFADVVAESRLAELERDESSLAMILLELEAKYDIELSDDFLSPSSTVREVAADLGALLDQQAASASPMTGLRKAVGTVSSALRLLKAGSLA